MANGDPWQGQFHGNLTIANTDSNLANYDPWQDLTIPVLDPTRACTPRSFDVSFGCASDQQIARMIRQDIRAFRSTNEHFSHSSLLPLLSRNQEMRTVNFDPVAEHQTYLFFTMICVARISSRAAVMLSRKRNKGRKKTLPLRHRLYSRKVALQHASVAKPDANKQDAIDTATGVA